MNSPEDGSFDPAVSDIEFVARSGENTTVHVMVPLIEGDQMIAGVNGGFLIAFQRIRTLCGRMLVWGDYHARDTFDDGRTCRQCIEAMGEHSDRLFEHAVPENAE